MIFTIRDRIIKLIDPPKSISYNSDYVAEFDFDEEWSDKVKTARFMQDDEYYDVILTEDRCAIPPFHRGYVKVGVYTDDFTSTTEQIYFKTSIKDDKVNPAEPPEDVYVQLLKLIESGMLRGDKGDAFTFADFTPEQIESLKVKGDKGETGAQGIQGIQGLKGDKGDKGEKGDTGAQGIQGIQGKQGVQGIKGDKGEPFRFSDFTPEQIESLKIKGDKGDTGAKGEQGIKGDTGAQGIQGLKGDKGDKGEPFRFSDFTPQQIESLKVKGDKGEPFRFSDFTPEQLASLKGAKGDKGDRGEKGDRGDALHYEDLTPEQISQIKGVKGDKGDKGEQGIQGIKGDKGDAFTFKDFTPEQLASLKGAKGDQGEKGDTGAQGIQGLKGDKGDKGDQGIQGVKGDKGDAFTFKDFTPEQLASLKGAKGDKGEKGDTGAKGSDATVTSTNIEKALGYKPANPNDIPSIDSMLTSLPSWTETPNDSTKLIRRDIGQGSTFGQVTFHTVWNYISNKISSVLGLTNANYGGLSAKATADGNGNDIANTYATKTELKDASNVAVSNDITFSDDGSINTAFKDGKNQKTEFNDDGSITTKYYKNGTLLSTEKTVFNEDGSISTIIS